MYSTKIYKYYNRELSPGYFLKINCCQYSTSKQVRAKLDGSPPSTPARYSSGRLRVMGTEVSSIGGEGPDDSPDLTTPTRERTSSEPRIRVTQQHKISARAYNTRRDEQARASHSRAEKYKEEARGEESDLLYLGGRQAG